MKGGWTMDRVKYSEWALYVAVRLIERRRPYMQLPDDAERGVRFNSNDAILARLESNYTEIEFNVCPGLSVEAMLLDAAKSDYWYAHDKDYGYESVEDNNEANDE